MSDSGQGIRQAGQKAKEAANDIEPDSWVEGFARVGNIAKGTVYILVGLLAAQAAMGPGEDAEGTTGALATLLTEPLGTVMLAIIALGLVAHALWRFSQALLDSGDEGSDVKGLARRAAHFGSGIVYGGLALFSAQLILGSSGGSGGGGSNAAEDWTARLLALPMGRWLVGLGGLAAIAIGLYYAYRAFNTDMEELFNTGQMSEGEERATRWIALVGRAARGFVIGIVGVLLIQAAWQYDPSEAGGLSDALSALARQPFGPWLLAAVAIGLIAFGFFCFAKARYRHVGDT